LSSNYVNAKTKEQTFQIQIDLGTEKWIPEAQERQIYKIKYLEIFVEQIKSCFFIWGQITLKKSST